MRKGPFSRFGYIFASVLMRRLAYWLIALTLGLFAFISDASATYYDFESIPYRPGGIDANFPNHQGFGSKPKEEVQSYCHGGAPTGRDYTCWITPHTETHEYVQRWTCSTTRPFMFRPDGSGSTSSPMCTSVPPDCEIPAGTTTTMNFGFSTPDRVCTNNCWHDLSGCPDGKCVGIGLSSGWYKPRTYTSDGTTCTGEQQSPDSSNFDDYTDSNDCYIAANLDTYCKVATDSPCPNYTIVNGEKYCKSAQEPDTDGDGSPDSTDPDPLNPDTDGDGAPDGSDPDPTNPDTDGDGAPDGSDPDPTNPDTDGDGTPDGSDPDANGNGTPDSEETEEEGGSTYSEGTCSPGLQVTEPQCDSDLDAIQCAIFLNNWHHRCESQQQFEQLWGTESDRETASAQGEEYLDSDLPDNQLPSSTPGDPGVDSHDFSDISSDLDDSGFLSGGCPGDISYTVYGKSFAFSYQPICDVMGMINPVIVALGWLAAALIIGRSLGSV